MKLLLVPTLAAICLVSSAQAAESPGPVEAAEASIPFVNRGGIRDWREDGRDAIYVQDQHRQWYRGTFLGSCNDLPFANAVGFETRGIDTFDRFGSVIVRGQRCALNSLVKSNPPPKADKKKRSIEKVEPSAATPST